MEQPGLLKVNTPFIATRLSSSFVILGGLYRMASDSGNGNGAVREPPASQDAHWLGWKNPQMTRSEALKFWRKEP